MTLARFLLNILWFVLGGIWMGIGWYLAGVLMLVTIIGIPWAFACFRIGQLAFWPFGKTLVRREHITGQHDIGTGPFGLLGNIIWFLLGGWWLAVGHVVAAGANAVTIIGLPFALQHLKLAILALAPLGKEVVEGDFIV